MRTSTSSVKRLGGSSPFSSRGLGSTTIKATAGCFLSSCSATGTIPTGSSPEVTPSSAAMAALRASPALSPSVGRSLMLFLWVLSSSSATSAVPPCNAERLDCDSSTAGVVAGTGEGVSTKVAALVISGVFSGTGSSRNTTDSDPVDGSVTVDITPSLSAPTPESLVDKSSSATCLGFGFPPNDTRFASCNSSSVCANLARTES
mmetsp:Transcript_8018/g.14185  ORF Transcript_8018/g.14185 Transcript_8018/m.14185 type:complete len:204 (-) Transcript_8018:24-635(-)